jgi:hypothetical protein
MGTRTFQKVVWCSISVTGIIRSRDIKRLPEFVECERPQTPSAATNDLTSTSYRLDNRHCAGAAKNSDEKEVTVGQRKATTKAREQRKRDQFPQAWRHLHTASDLNA